MRTWLWALDLAADPLVADVPKPQVSPPPAPDRQTLRTLVLRARNEGRCLRLRYAGRERGAVSLRTVEPHAVETRHGVLYLSAFCQWRQAHRYFRLDHILAAELLDDRFDGDGGPAPSPLR